MRITRPIRLTLWSSAAALLLAAGLVWKERQDRVNPLVHGQRLDHWVAELDRFPGHGEPMTESAPVTPLAADYLRDVPRLAPARIVAFLKTRNSTARQIRGWCEQHLPKPVLALVPQPWVCQHPRRVVCVLSDSSFGPDPGLRAELESLAQDADPGLHEPAYRALFLTGWYPRGYYTNVMEAAPLLAAGLQLSSGGVHQIVLDVLSELNARHRLSEWPASLPPLIPLIEPIAQNRSDLALQFIADGLLRDLGAKRPIVTARLLNITPPGPVSGPAGVWERFDPNKPAPLNLPPVAYVPGDRVSVKNFGDGISAGTVRHLRE